MERVHFPEWFNGTPRSHKEFRGASRMRFRKLCQIIHAIFVSNPHFLVLPCLFLNINSAKYRPLLLFTQACWLGSVQKLICKDLVNERRFLLVFKKFEAQNVLLAFFSNPCFVLSLVICVEGSNCWHLKHHISFPGWHCYYLFASSS